MAESYLDKQISSHPEIKDDLSEMKLLYKQRLWHQLTGVLMKFVNKETTLDGKFFVDFYSNFVAEFETKMNPRVFAIIVGFIAQKLVASSKVKADEVENAISFLEDIKRKEPKKDIKGRYVGISPDTKDAHIVLDMAIVDLYLKHPERDTYLEKAYEAIKKAEKVLPELVGTGSEASVNMWFHRVSYHFYGIVGPSEKYYEAMIQFLAYTPVDMLSSEEQRVLAKEIIISSFIGQELFNFGEILQLNVIASLKGTDDAFLIEMLKSLNDGDIDNFSNVFTVHETALMAIPKVQANVEVIRQKIGLMCLMKLVFDRVSSNRTIPLEQIAKETKVGSEQAEWMIMRAMSKGLIKGKIDGVKRVVHISWLKPRVLGNNQMTMITEKLNKWTDDVQKSLKYLSEPETIAPPAEA